MSKVKQWYDDKKLPFILPKITENDEPFELQKFIPKKKYNYVSDFINEYINIINQYQVVLIYSKKDMGKSFIGYLWMKDFFRQNLGNAIYGRLQDKEKQSAKVELFRVFEDLKMKPYYNKNYGKDYILFDQNDYNLRLVNISSYQSLRGAIGDNNKFIWFDELNAYNFPVNFEANFINILSTLGRKNNFRFLGTANNETANNNPVLNALQLKFNWNFNGVQIATRSIAGVKIIGIQLGYEAFTSKNISIAERLARNNTALYNTFYLGLSNTNAANKVINLKEDYKISKTLFYFAHEENIYSFNKGSINDEENGFKNNNCILVKLEPYNYDSKFFNKSLPIYTDDTVSDLIFKNAKYLKMEELATFLKPYIVSLKQDKLYFVDFESNDAFLQIFSQNHPELQKDEIIYYDKIKEFK